MKKILLLFLMIFLIFALASCQVGTFLKNKYDAEYYLKNEDGSYSNESYIGFRTDEDDVLRAYHTYTFQTDEEIDIKNKDIVCIAGSFNVHCEVITKFHITLKWTQGFWYKDEVFVDEYVTVKPDDTELYYECDLYDKEEGEETGFKIPSDNNATVIISITAYIDEVESKDFMISFKNLEFCIGDHNEEVLEDENLKPKEETTA